MARWISRYFPKYSLPIYSFYIHKQNISVYPIFWPEDELNSNYRKTKKKEEKKNIKHWTKTNTFLNGSCVVRLLCQFDACRALSSYRMRWCRKDNLYRISFCLKMASFIIMIHLCGNERRNHSANNWKCSEFLSFLKYLS